MKQYQLQNEYLILTVSEIGAEIISLRTAKEGKELIWQGAPGFWSEHAPLLFPAVGDWKENRFDYKGNIYEMPVHGFARFRPFEICCEESRIICTLRSDEQSAKYYPFSFCLTIIYTLDQNTVQAEQFIRNTAEEPMPYSIGEHIGFQVPWSAECSYEDYTVEFDMAETADRYPLKNGREIGEPIPCLKGEKTIRLNQQMFAEGAWNFAGLRSQRATLKEKDGDTEVILDFPNFTHFSLWSQPNAPFLCMEPCNGIAASAEEGYDLFRKKGIRILDGGKEDTVVYSITVEDKQIRKKLRETFENSIIEKRISVRKFSKRIVTREKITAVLQHAMTAPSAGNNREWEFFVIEKEKDKAQISGMSPYARPAANAAALIVPCMNREKAKADSQGNFWWIQDMAACCQTILLGAKEEGLDSVWMGIYPDPERMQKLTEYLNCGESLLPFAVIALGYGDGRTKKKARYDESLVHYF